MVPRFEAVVGVPTYNNESTIGRTLDQLFAQRRPPDRIIVCDNSTDRTVRVAEEKAAESEVPVEILQQEGDGVASAYNQMWRHAHPEFDVFATIQTNLTVDEDWLAGHLRVHDHHPEMGVVTGTDADLREEVEPTDGPYYRGRNVSFKREALEAVEGWDANFLRGEDWDMRIRLAGAGVRSFACSALAHGWMDERSDLDPYITLSKARRRPTVATFLAKYGPWYLRFHPSHVVHDLLSVAGLVFGLGTLLLVPASLPLAVGAFLLFVSSVACYAVGHLLLGRPVDGSRLRGPFRKQLLNGVAVLYALRRVAATSEWNRAGFDPENTPRFGF